MGKISCHFVGNPVRAFDVSVAKEKTTMHVPQRVFHRTETILTALNGIRVQPDIGRFGEKVPISQTTVDFDFENKY